MFSKPIDAIALEASRTPTGAVPLRVDTLILIAAPGVRGPFEVRTYWEDLDKNERFGERTYPFTLSGDEFDGVEISQPQGFDIRAPRSMRLRFHIEAQGVELGWMPLIVTWAAGKTRPS